jgi:hypothetical protein
VAFLAPEQGGGLAGKLYEIQRTFDERGRSEPNLFNFSQYGLLLRANLAGLGVVHCGAGPSVKPVRVQNLNLGRNPPGSQLESLRKASLLERCTARAF